MRDKISIGLDVDDVLAGFYLEMCNRFGGSLEQIDIWGQDASVFINKHWDKVKSDEDFWENLPVISDPKDITFKFDYYISAFPVEMFEARKRWLDKNGFPEKPIICAHNKSFACKEYGVNVLIDDKKTTIKDIMCAGDKLGIWFRPSYMIEAGQDITNLSQVPGIIKKYL